MKLEEIQGKPDAELKQLVEQGREELWKARFASTTEPIDNPGKIRDLRKRLARIQGELRARELKTTREKVNAELGKGPRTTREVAHALFGGSRETAQRELLRLQRKGELKSGPRAPRPVTPTPAPAPAPAAAAPAKAAPKGGKAPKGEKKEKKPRGPKQVQPPVMMKSATPARVWSLKPARAGGEKK